MKKIVTIIACFGILTVFGQCATNPILVQPAVFCVGDSIDLEITNIPFGATVIWDNSSDSLNGEVYTGSKIKVLATRPKQFRVTIVDPLGCITYRFTSLNAGFSPGLSYGANDSLCAGTSFSLAVTTNATSFVWSFKNSDTSGILSGPFKGVMITGGGKTLSSSGDPYWNGKTTEFKARVTGAEPCPAYARFPVTVFNERVIDTVMTVANPCVGDTISVLGSIGIGGPWLPEVYRTSWNILPDTNDIQKKNGVSTDTFRFRIPNTDSRMFRFKVLLQCDNRLSISQSSQGISPIACGALSQSWMVQTMANGVLMKNKDSIFVCAESMLQITGITQIGNTIHIVPPFGMTTSGQSVYSKNETVYAGSQGWWKIQSRNGSSVVKTDSLFVRVRALPSLTMTAPNLFCKGDTMTVASVSSTPLISTRWYYESTLIDSGRLLVKRFQPGTYLVTVTDSFGCSQSVSKYIGKLPSPNFYSQSSGNTYCCGSNITKFVMPNTPVDSVGAVYQWYHLDSLGNATALMDGLSQFPGMIISGSTTNTLGITTTGGMCGSSMWMGPQYDYCVVSVPGKCRYMSDSILSIGIFSTRPLELLLDNDTACLGTVITATQLTTSSSQAYQTGSFGTKWYVDDTLITTAGNVFSYTPTTVGNHIVKASLITNYCMMGASLTTMLHIDSCIIPITYCDTLVIRDTNYMIQYDTVPVYVHDTIDRFNSDTITYLVIDTLFKLIVDTVTMHDTALVTMHDTTLVIMYDTVLVAVRDTVRLVTLVLDTVSFRDTVLIGRIDTLLMRDTVMMHDTVSLIVHDTIRLVKIDSFFVLQSMTKDTVRDTIPFGCSIALYPNPTNDLMTVYPPDPTVVSFDVFIYDAMGKLVYTRNYPQGIISLRTDTDLLLTSGSYVILLKEYGGKKRFICRFVKLDHE